jgi:hypothetical protein
MRWDTAIAIATILLASCKDGPTSEPHEDFAACDGGVYLLGACEPLPACDGACPEAVALADTNLTACMGPAESGEDGTIACPGEAGADACATTEGCGQDAQYGGPSSDRFERGAGEEPVVHDAVTGLDWMGCALGQTGGGCSGEGALSDWHVAEAACEESGWGGFTDWRLPRADELHSLVDFSTTGPAADLAAFPNTPSRFAEDYDAWWMDCVWSGTDHANDADVAWALMVNSGDVAEGSGTTYHLHDKDAEGWDGCYTRCVRATETPTTGRWLRAGSDEEPVVADLRTERLWQGCSAGQSGAGCSGEAELLDWHGALAHCEGLSYGGIGDWRLPDIRELYSLADPSVAYPAIDADMFPNTPYYGPSTVPNVGQYWSSTARSYNSFALYVDFGAGFSHFYVMDETRHVRCVSG